VNIAIHFISEKQSDTKLFLWRRYLFRILPIWSVVPFIMEKVLLPIFCLVMVVCSLPYCLLIILCIFFLSYPFFFCKACFKWLRSMYKWIDCFCAGWWCDSACIYPYVLVFCTLDDLEYCQLFLVTRTSKKGSFLFSSLSMVKRTSIVGILIVEKN